MAVGDHADGHNYFSGGTVNFFKVGIQCGTKHHCGIKCFFDAHEHSTQAELGHEEEANGGAEVRFEKKIK